MAGEKGAAYGNGLAQDSHLLPWPSVFGNGYYSTIGGGCQIARLLTEQTALPVRDRQGRLPNAAETEPSYALRPV